jgi:acyl-CoA synthetase (AMP-forming)/AMP-acid ligase II
MYPGTHAAKAPDRPAIVMGSGDVVTYRELDDRSMQLAQLLHAQGLRVGDHIAIFAENHPRYFEVYWAALRSGLYLTAVNRHLKAEEAAYLVNDSGASALITTAALAPVAEEMVGYLRSCPIRLMMDGIARGFVSYETAIGEQPATPLATQPRGDVMLYSSGTTGQPKGIKRPLSGLAVDDPAAAGMSRLEELVLGMGETSVYLCPAPLYHSAGLQWSAGALELGATLVIMERFDAEGFLQLVERERVSHVQVVPTMFIRLLKLDEAVRASYDVSSLRGVIHAAAPCPIDVKRRMIAWLGPIVDEYYAATEGNGLTYIRSEEWLDHPGSVGRPLLGTLHICDEEGNDLEPGQPGLVYFEQPQMVWEYHGEPEKTRGTRHPHHLNWAALGDIGYMDEDGYLYLTDRRAFTIISGGVNIYPAEIESCLVVHPKVLDAAVFGLPDTEMGEYVHAVVQLDPGVEATPELAAELREFVRTNLAGYKAPRVVDFREELPRSANGKLYKKPLRDEYLAGATAGN